MIGQVFAHSDKLTALTGKDKRKIAHMRSYTRIGARLRRYAQVRKYRVAKLLWHG
ncbi:MAG: hypothetical protein Hens2KO_12300 [Henriciella sp.]